MSAEHAEKGELAPEVREALAKAADLRLIGLLFERPSGARRGHVLALAAECPDAALRELAVAMAEVEDGSYQSVFANGGPVSPREAAYMGRRDPGQSISELGELYTAFGYTPIPGEPPDHIATETGFAAFLWMKEAFARTQGNVEGLEVTQAARARFVSDHLSVLANGLAYRITGGPEALVTLAKSLVDRVGAAPVREEDLLAADEEDEISCGPVPQPPAGGRG